MYKGSVALFGVMLWNNCSNSPSQTRLIRVASPSTFPIFFSQQQENKLSLVWVAGMLVPVVGIGALVQPCSELVGQRLFRASSRCKQKKQKPREVTWSLAAACFVRWSLLLLSWEKLGKLDSFQWGALSDPSPTNSSAYRSRSNKFCSSVHPHCSLPSSSSISSSFSQDRSQKIQANLRIHTQKYFFSYVANLKVRAGASKWIEKGRIMYQRITCHKCFRSHILNAASNRD